jgi:hypothetical protein
MKSIGNSPAWKPRERVILPFTTHESGQNAKNRRSLPKIYLSQMGAIDRLACQNSLYMRTVRVFNLSLDDHV